MKKQLFFLLIITAPLFAHDAKIASEAREKAATDSIRMAVEQEGLEPEKIVVAQQKPKEPEIFTIDEIKAVVFGEEGAQVITKSDVERPGIDGSPRTLDDLVLERLLFLDAKKYNMISDEDAVDKYLANIQRENNMSMDDLKNLFSNAGYTYQEGREQFGTMQAVNSIMDFRIRSRLMIPEREIVAYHKAHPDEEPERYFIQRAVVPITPDTTKTVVEKQLELLSKTGRESVKVEWSDGFWLERSDIAQDKEFIYAMKQGDISSPQGIDGGFEVYRLADKKERKVRTLDERRLEIENELRLPRFERLFTNYKAQLFDSTSVLYFTS